MYLSYGLDLEKVITFSPFIILAIHMSFYFYMILIGGSLDTRVFSLVFVNGNSIFKSPQVVLFCSEG